MKQLLQIIAAIGLALLVTACDKCGTPNFNKPNFCGDAPART